jgi:toxin ParE1/3/4
LRTKSVILREQADRDIQLAIDCYTTNAGPATALAFVDQLEQAFRRMAEYPASGSLRYAYELELPGLRSLALKRFPYLIFYFAETDIVDVWRVLHGEMDIPAWMRDPSGE